MNNQVLVVVGSDGRIEYTHQDGVFRRSNKQNELVALLLFPNAATVKVNFLRSDGVKPKTQYMSYIGQQEYEGAMYNAYGYLLSDYQLYVTGPLVVSLDIVRGSVTSTSGDFTIDVEASEGEYDDEAPTDTNQFDEAIDSLMLTDRVLIDRTENVPNLVAGIQKVAGNAFTYTNNSGVESAPIVLSGGAGAPIPVNTASTIKVPKEAFMPVEGGYSYTVAAAIHGQMRDGAVARDLWVSFDEAEEAAFKGAYEDYTVNAAGDITITVTTPIDLTVRVWNGKGLVDDVARADIATETARAESAENTIRTDLTAMINAETARAENEETKLQNQITYLQNSGIDIQARTDIKAEAARAEEAEATLRSDIEAETERAQNAEDVLSSDIEGLREDINNEAHFRGYLSTNAEIEALSATPNDYAYSAESGTVWIYQTDTGWTDSEKPVPDKITPASNTTPLMDGTAAVGVAEEYARGDHRHPSDTTKANLAGAIFTGNVSAPQITGTNGIFDGTERVYSAVNPPPATMAKLIITLESGAQTLTDEQTTWLRGRPTEVGFLINRFFYSMSENRGTSLYYTCVEFQSDGNPVFSSIVIALPASGAATWNGIVLGNTAPLPPRLSLNAMAVRSITFKKRQYFTLYLTPLSEFMKGAYISETVGKPYADDPSKYDGSYFKTLKNNGDSSVSTNLTNPYQPWSYIGGPSCQKCFPELGDSIRGYSEPNSSGEGALPDIRIGQQTYTSDGGFGLNLGYMAIANSYKPWALRIQSYRLTAEGVNDINYRIGVRYLNSVPHEGTAAKPEYGATAIMFSAISAIADASLSVIVCDGDPYVAGTQSVTYSLKLSVVDET